MYRKTQKDEEIHNGPLFKAVVYLLHAGIGIILFYWFMAHFI